MKLAAFTDPHANTAHLRSVEKLVKQHNPDAVVCTGDLSIFEQNIEDVIKWFGSLPARVFLIHGNHEEENIVKKLCTYYKNITFAHKKLTSFKQHTFFGWGGGGFAFTDPGFERWAKTLPAKIPNGIFLTHQPPHNTKLDVVARRHVGNKSFKQFVERHQELKLYVSGHIHECFNRTSTVGKVRIINPGPSGKLIEI